MSESLAAPFTAVAAEKKKRLAFLPVIDLKFTKLLLQSIIQTDGKTNRRKANSYCTFKTPGYCLTIISTFCFFKDTNRNRIVLNHVLNQYSASHQH